MKLTQFSGSKGKALHKVPALYLLGRSVRPLEIREINVMAVSGIYAMVRRPRCMPYVAPRNQLYEVYEHKLDKFIEGDVDEVVVNGERRK